MLQYLQPVEGRSEPTKYEFLHVQVKMLGYSECRH